MTLWLKIKAFFLSVITFILGIFGVTLPGENPERVDASFTRFVVMSDVHFPVGEVNSIEEQRLDKLFKVVYDYSRADSDHPTLDGLFVAGDFTNRGTQAEMNRFFERLNAGVLPETTARVALGNHEFSSEPLRTVKRFLTASGYEDEDADIVINGFHFILLSPSSYSGFSREKALWLDKRLASATAADAQRPIFVIQHHHVKNTVYGSSAWGVDNLKSVLAKYPQVVDFSGHSHYPINDPRSIWQGDFTALGTGTLSYYEMGIAGVTDRSIFPLGKEGDYTTNKNSPDAAQFYFVEVSKDNSIKIKGYDLLSDTFICEYDLKNVHDKSQYTYTNARKETADEPVFSKSAEIKLDTVGCSFVNMSIPQAICKDTVQHYRFELYNADNKKIATQYRLSGSYYFPTPTKITASFDSLAEGKYTVKCYAVSSWEKESVPLQTAFKIQKANHGDVGCYESEITPDIFSLRFADDGCAFNGVNKSQLSSYGNSVSVAKNSVTGLNEGLFSSTGCYTYKDFKNSYNAIKKNVTLEFYGTPVQPDGSYYNILANLESAGIGLELDRDGNMQLYININGKYHHPSAKVEFNKPVHFVATFDGSCVKLYVNGRLADSVSISGEINFKMAEEAQYLCIGGDSGSGSPQALFKGKLCIANVYGRALNGDEVSTLYRQINALR